MSKEKEPIRSRRELREQSVNAAGATEQPSVPVRPAPSTPPSSAPVPPADAGSDSPAPRERQSQTRARDRAALRAYKELIDPPGLSPLPSRRTLRQAQLDAERAPVTAVNPVVQVSKKLAKPAPAAPSEAPTAPAAPSEAPTTPAAPSAAAPSEAPPVTAQAPTTAPKNAVPKKAAVKNPQPAAKPVREPSAAPQQPSAAGARNRGGRRAAAMNSALEPQPAAAGEVVAPAQPGEVQAESPEHAGAVIEPAPGASSAEPIAQLPEAAAVANGYSPLPGLVPGGSYYPISAGPPPATTPSTEELAVLAAQKAEDERTAVLALRAQARERLAQESAKSRRTAADPTATNNLAMVTPLEFIEVPGVSRPVLRPPTTTHVPIVTRATPRQTPAGKNRAGQQRQNSAAGGSAASASPATASNAVVNAPEAVEPSAQAHGKGSATVPNVSAERFDAALAARAVHRPGPGNRPLTGGRSSTLKRAEEMATGGHPTIASGVEQVEVTRSQMPPMPADYAHGLEPLDAMTAGLGRTQRNMLIQWGSIIVGGAAFVVGAIMFITTLTR
ncbi:hypothetical protein [Arthrobacter glacialis]|uniref:hypothetical protein n=1 Tax=Arthrobacter glacialis TaxID=1664 RepID=UPI000CD449A7|nr:hypothetical protein [Arthrobacter glacialis]POH58848.1 hypothetical protein CVS28_09040 [Arthrobacter glacialis]